MEEKIIQKEKKKINFKLIFFIIFIIVIIGVICYSKNIIEEGNVWYVLDDASIGVLKTSKKSPTKYYQINTYDEYMEMYNSIGQLSKKISNDAIKLDLIADLIEQAFILGDYTEEFFEKNALLLVENFTYEKVILEQKIEDIDVKENILVIRFINTIQEKKSDGGKGILHFITVPKKHLKNVNEIQIDFNNTNIS